MTTSVQCPACDESMVRENFASALIDVCGNGCHGLWFDAGELAKLDYHKKGFGPALERSVAHPGSSSPRDRVHLECPKCQTALDEVEYELAQSVLVDECPACGGIYLDAGELARIRCRAPTGAEQAQASRHKRARKRSRQRVIDEAARRRQTQMICLTSMLKT